jgi:hypothetical protein
MPDARSVASPVTEAVLIDLLAASDPSVTGEGLDRITFKWMPEMFDESKQAEYANINIIGRSEPILGYSHSSPRVFQISLVFAAEVNPYEEVIRPIWLIRSWVYPDYRDEVMPNVPPRVLLVVGNWLSQRCVAIRVDVKYHGPWGRGPVSTQGKAGLGNSGPVPGGSAGGDKDSMLPYWAEVGLVLQEVMENTRYTPYDTMWVRRGWDRGSGFFPDSSA